MRLKNNIPYIKHEKIEITDIKNRLDQMRESIWNMDITRNDGPHVNRQLLLGTTNLILQYCRGEPEIDKKFLEMFPVYKSGKLPIHHDLYWIPNYEDFKKDIQEIKQYDLDAALEKSTRIIIKKLEHQFNGISGLVTYARLPAGKNIGTHADAGYYLCAVHRLHIPIFTNNKCIFKLGSTDFHMEEGYLYEINNQLSHSVENHSSQDRIHLIIDIIPHSELNTI